MRRRLFDGLDQGLGEEVLVIEGLPAPTRQRGFGSLAVALQLALQAAGQSVPYAELMARTGAAFMLRFAPDFSPELPLQDREAHVVEALRELGREPELLDQPTPEQALTAVRREITAGRPACALGWGSNPSEWALLAGLQGNDLLGHPFGGTGRLERKPATVSCLLVPGPAVSRPADAWPATIARAEAILRANAPHYHQWLALLDQPEPYGPALGQMERFLGEQRLSEALADARDAAAQFLSLAVSTVPVEAEDDFSQAANVAERLAEDAEKLLVSPDVIQRAHLPEDLDWRHDRQALLRTMASLEEQLADLLHHSLWLAGIDSSAGE